MSTIIYAVSGTFCNDNIWTELRKNICSEIQIINIDIPAKSTVNEIVKLLDIQLPVEASNLLGFSFGGFLVSAFALKFPHRVKKLLVISDSLDKLPPEEIRSRQQYVSYIERNGFAGLDKKVVAAVLHANNKDDVGLHEKIAEMSTSMRSLTVQNQLLATITRENIYKALSDILIPVYIALGDMDKTVNKHIIDAGAINNTNIYYEEISDSGHFLPLEQPTKFAKVVMRWLAL